MEIAVEYTEKVDAFKALLLAVVGVTLVEVLPGRRFDRVRVDGQVKYFIDRHSWEIFGAKSYFQYNPRRVYGKLDTTDQFEWEPTFPKTGTVMADTWAAREAAIKASYKPRGRPRKNPVVSPDKTPEPVAV